MKMIHNLIALKNGGSDAVSLKTLDVQIREPFVLD